MAATAPLRSSVRSGDWIAISGQLGLRDGQLVDGGVTEQAKQALANFTSILESHGASIVDVVKTTVFLTTMDNYAGMNDEYARVFSNDPPARSAIAVHQLPLGGLVEIEGWVRLPQTDG